MTTLTLPALAFLLAISGIPGTGSLPWFKAFLHHKPHPTAADSLPPPWKSASRLALERDFVSSGLHGFGTDGTMSLKLTSGADPRKLRNSMDPDSGFWHSSVEVNGVGVGTPVRRPLADFGSGSLRESFADKWRARSRQDINHTQSGAVTSAHSGLSLPIPVQLPSVVSSLLGPGGPALNVSGSESIRLSGTSNWTNQETGILGQKRSLFPSLDMQQDLNIQLEGQLSDRVKVNLLQNSANQVPLSNRIAINYKGEEDDLIQGLDLGNTSLALPGTQYVSYSGKNEGLFGVKLATRVGPFDWTVLASKQEGRSERASYTGGASVNSQVLADLEYEHGRYFLLYDPLDAQRLYKIDDTTIQIWRDDANYGNDNLPTLGKAMIDPDAQMGVLAWYRAHGDTITTLADTAAVRGRFDLLKPVDDYEILPDYYVFNNGVAFKIIRLKTPVTNDMILAATYTALPVDVNGATVGAPLTVGGSLIAAPDPDAGRRTMKLLRPPRSLLVAADPSNLTSTNFDATSMFDVVRELEMKNFYQLSGYQIDPKSFKLAIQRGTTQPPRNYAADQSGVDVDYIEVLGLDNLDESQATAKRGHDGKVDGTGYASGVRAYVDFANGVVWFPDPRPFAPRLADGNAGRWFDKTMEFNINRRLRLKGAAGTDSAANLAIYDKYSVDRNQDPQYYLTVSYAAQRGGGDITLGRGNLLAGSEAVTVNGERWTRDRDYSIDYDLGRLTLKRTLGPTDQLSVDYSYAPMFAQAGKTLLGSAFRLEGRDQSVGGAFLYESRGAQDLRPRLGEEPARTLITDMNTEFRFKPTFLTRLADRLPGVHTSAPSDLTVQAEVGASFPNPNTKNVVYIDDTEGVRDAISLALSADHWRLSSVPSRPLGMTANRQVISRQWLLADTTLGVHNAELHWYMPPNYVKEHDLKPNLSDAQGGQNPRQVLALSVPQTPAKFQPGDSLWAGLTYQLDEQGLDLSRSQFIEIWVNDFNDRHDPAIPDHLVRGDTTTAIGLPGVRLHIDLGTVSEDQMRAPNRPPDGLLQSEDKPPRDHQLTVTEGNNEDTGYDGLLDAQERSIYQAHPEWIADLATANADDPEGDDYGDPDNSYHDIDPRKFLRSNGTDGNKKLYPYPDTEDLNLNENLDTTENYYEYTIDLSDRPNEYIDTDLQALHLAKTADNGWRRYRISLADSLRVQFGAPDLTQARHVRVWIDGLRDHEPWTAAERHPLLMIGGFDIVGSRWVQTQLTARQRDTVRTTMTLNSVNTVDNADVYVAPFDPGTTLNGSQTAARREQSISMEFTDLAADDTLEAYRAFSIDEDYSRYGTLTWYAAAFDVANYDPARDSLYYFVRFASDERGDSYYEIKRKLPASSAPLAIGWQEAKAVLAELSNFKLSPDFPKADPILFRTPFGAAGDSLVIKGRPSFTRLRRVSIGLINAHAGGDRSGKSFPRGQLWFDELRATDVAKDVGIADRLNVGGHIANVASFNVAWNSRDADFISVGDTRGSGSRSTNLAVTSSIDTHRFFEGTGIQLPVSMVWNQSVLKPRFTAGDDVVRTGAQQDASQTRNTSRSVSAAYSRVWSERSNPLLRYTIGGVTANASRTVTQGVSPTGQNMSVSNSQAVNWLIAPRMLLPIELPFTKAKLFPLPERVSVNYLSSDQHSTAYSRSVNDATQLQLANDVYGKVAGLDLSADTRPLDILTHHIDAHRALTLSNVSNQRFAGLNLGRTTNWRQNLGTRYQLQGAPWLRPSFSWGSAYTSNADLQSPDLSVHGVGNTQTVQMNWDIPLDQILHTAGAAGVPQRSEPIPMRHTPRPPHANSHDRGEPIDYTQPGRPSFGPQQAAPADSTGAPAPGRPAPADSGRTSAPGFARVTASDSAHVAAQPPAPGATAAATAPVAARVAPPAVAPVAGPPFVPPPASAPVTPAPSPAPAVAPVATVPPRAAVTPSPAPLVAPVAAATPRAPSDTLVGARPAQLFGGAPALTPSAAPAPPAPAPSAPVAGTPGTMPPDSARGAVPGIGPGGLPSPGYVAGPPENGPPPQMFPGANAADSVRRGPPGTRPLSKPGSHGSSLPLRALLSRLGSIQTDYSLNRSSSFSRLSGTPGLLYMIGLTDDPGLSDTSKVAALNGNTRSQGFDWRANARTRVAILYGSAVNLRLSVGDRTNTVNGVATRQTDTRFPDLDVEFGRVADVIQLSRFLEQPQIHTSWVHQTTGDYRGTVSSLQGRSQTDEYRPLLSVRGNLANGTSVDLSMNVRDTRQEVFQYGTSVTTDNNSDLNLTLSRSYSQGQKVTFLGKTKTVRSNISMQVATVYSHHTGQTIVSYTSTPTRLIDESRLSVTGTGSYGFSTSVTGSAVLGFSQNKDNTRSIVNRSVRVELRAQFSF